MKILSGSQIREADAYTMLHQPISSINLMERAAEAFTTAFMAAYPHKTEIIIFCGPGNNGGDGLAIARMLYREAYPVRAYVLDTGRGYSPDFTVNRERLTGLGGVPVTDLKEIGGMPDMAKDTVVIDALFGTGLSRKTDGLAAQVIDAINDAGMQVVAVDMPSGLYTDRANDPQDSIIKAAHTFTFQLPKRSFFYCSNEGFTGRWQILDIGLEADFIENAETGYYYTDSLLARTLLKLRRRCDHKGTYGHALIMAGAYGKMGAAQLCAHACMNAGAGLTTAWIPECGYTIFQTALPEIMVMTDPDPEKITDLPVLEKYSAIGVGPGIGTHLRTVRALAELLKEAREIPMVIDADALNMLAQHPALLARLPRHCVLTPHPKEFERLAGPAKNDWEQQEMASRFARTHHCVLVLKGAYTSTNLPDGSAYFNATGNPGMAKGGSGDALTGIITGLLAQHYPPAEAAILGVYLHGLAGDIAARKTSQWSMRATDLIQSLGEGFNLVE